jgi:hypothetical protein
MLQPCRHKRDLRFCDEWIVPNKPGEDWRSDCDDVPLRHDLSEDWRESRQKIEHPCRHHLAQKSCDEIQIRKRIKCVKLPHTKEDVGGAAIPLTAEVLRSNSDDKQAVARSDSESSDSRNESDYRKSATTRPSTPENESVIAEVEPPRPKTREMTKIHRELMIVRQNQIPQMSGVGERRSHETREWAAA